jgi:hypothetical protein
MAANKSIDSAGVMNFGSGTATTINIGRSGQTVNLLSATNSITVTDLHVQDKNIVLNKSGVAASAGLVGVQFEEDGVITGYMQ